MYDKINFLAEKIAKADAVVVGGGSGLSSSSGYNHYHWSDYLEKELYDFKEHYGFKSPFDGFYHCFSTYEEMWGYYSKYTRFMWDAPLGQPYIDLKEILKDKEKFILTTNIDMQFSKAFDENDICSFQGDFSFCQCSQPCEDKLYNTYDMCVEMTDNLIDKVRIPKELVPRCKYCGRVMVPWVRDDTFLEGKYWKEQFQRYNSFLNKWIVDSKDKNVLLLELGVGEMTPSIIKLPFWDMAQKNENVFYACLNYENSQSPKHIGDRGIYVQGDLKDTLGNIKKILC